MEVTRIFDRIFHIAGGTCHLRKGRAALPRRPELGRSSSFALPGYEIARFTLAALLALTGCRKEEQPMPEPPAPTVEGETVTYVTNAPQLAFITAQAAEPRTAAVTHLTGRLCWNDDQTVRVFTPVAGRVTALRADLGDAIAAGATLAEIDSPDFSQALASARTAAGNLAAADKAFTRSKELKQNGAAAQKDVEAAEAAYVAALAERDRAESVLANYGGNDHSSNSLYILRSPLAGVLVEKNINPGQELRADLMLANAPNLFAPIFVISDPAKLWLQLDVAEPDLASLRPGQQLRVWSTNALPGRVFEGTIDKIADTLDPLTRTVKVRGSVNNPDKLLKAEMYVLADILAGPAAAAQAGVDVSAKALFMKGGDSYVFLEESPGRFHRVRVKVGVEKDNRVPVLEGVSAGQKVVIEGALLLQAVLEPAS
jgi:cobalt-zinc-cadmium efflux system membrane fusion protein